MRVAIISEYGYHEALLGLGLSFGKTSPHGLSTLQKDTELTQQLHERAKKLSGMGNGHDKFLRMLMVTLDIKAPLYWWKEFDTYKVATVTQSESTMHTLMKRELTEDDFEGDIPQQFLNELNQARKQGDEYRLFKLLPQSFLQRRIVMTNYAVLLNIFNQRHSHKLPEWKEFCVAIIMHTKHWQLLFPRFNNVLEAGAKLMAYGEPIRLETAAKEQEG